MHAVTQLSGGAPVKFIKVLQHGKHAVTRTQQAQPVRQMRWSQMGFTKQREHARLRMSAAYLRDLCGGMAITRGDLAHVASRLQVNSINRAAELSRLAQQMPEGLPVVAPFVV